MNHLTAIPEHRPRSQVRALTRDLATMMIQQMYFWGCDARNADGNVLVRLGAQRIARASSGGEGSSRYRFAWEDGTVELHSFCTGWYPVAPEQRGDLYSWTRTLLRMHGRDPAHAR